MTKDEVIALAREAGLDTNDSAWLSIRFERFAALVAAHEREECAKVVWRTPSPADEYVSLRDAIAAAIRNRSN